MNPAEFGGALNIFSITMNMSYFCEILNVWMNYQKFCNDIRAPQRIHPNEFDQNAKMFNFPVANSILTSTWWIAKI